MKKDFLNHEIRKYQFLVNPNLRLIAFIDKYKKITAIKQKDNQWLPLKIKIIKYSNWVIINKSRLTNAQIGALVNNEITEVNDNRTYWVRQRDKYAEYNEKAYLYLKSSDKIVHTAKEISNQFNSDNPHMFAYDRRFSLTVAKQHNLWLSERNAEGLYITSGIKCEGPPGSRKIDWNSLTVLKRSSYEEYDDLVDFDNWDTHEDN